MRLISDLIYILSTGALFLLAFILASAPNPANRYGLRWLAFFITLLGLIFLETSIQLLQISGIEELAALSAGAFMLAAAPAFYQTVNAYIRPIPTLRIGLLAHFLPCAAYVVLVAMAGIFFPATKRTLFLENWGSLISSFLTAFLMVQVITYVILALLKLRTHQQSIRAFSSSVTYIDLAWLEYFIYGILSFCLLWIAEVFFPVLADVNSIAYGCTIYYLAFFAFRQKEIYPFAEQQKADVLQIIEPKRSALRQIPSFDSHQDLQKIKLHELMQREKPYLDNELTLPKLAAAFQTTTHELSYLLNNGFGENFYDFVNRYRVEESKRLLHDVTYSHLSMVGIFLEAGFNSKTAFNTAFKRVTGTTPSAFKASRKS